MEVLNRDAVRAFEDELIQHLGGFAPKHSQALGETGLRRVVQLGLQRSSNYGLTNRGPVRFYIELMFMLGSYFDTDPQLPWAAEALTDKTIRSQMARSDQLYDKSVAYLDRVAGRSSSYARVALRKASEVRLEQFSESIEKFERVVVRQLNEIYPEKCEYSGEEILRSLVRRAIESALSYSISSPAGYGLLTGLMFLLGHGVTTDPQFPWIAETLNQDAITDPNRRVERLHSKTITYFREIDTAVDE